MSEPLEPCPFCGGKAELVCDNMPETNYKAVICRRCECGTSFVECEGTAIYAWNRRSQPKEQKEEARVCPECVKMREDFHRIFLTFAHAEGGEKGWTFYYTLDYMRKIAEKWLPPPWGNAGTQPPEPPAKEGGR